MTAGFNVLKDILAAYNGSGSFLIVYLVALILIYVIGSKEDKELFFFPTLAIIIVLFNPFTVYFIANYMGSDIYWRTLWIFQVCLAVAYIAVKAINFLRLKTQKVTAFVLMLILIAVTGKFMFVPDNYQVSDNLYKLPKEVIPLTEIIKNNDTDGDILAVFPPELVCYIRQYDANVNLLYGREQIKYGVTYGVEPERREAINNVFAVLYGEESKNFEKLLLGIQYDEPEYIVIKRDSEAIVLIEKMDYKYIGDAYDYQVFAKQSQ
ncbi:MAG: hypothetical protein RR956_06695 [Christensenella sp.]